MSDRVLSHRPLRASLEAAGGRLRGGLGKCLIAAALLTASMVVPAPVAAQAQSEPIELLLSIGPDGKIGFTNPASRRLDKRKQRRKQRQRQPIEASEIEVVVPAGEPSGRKIVAGPLAAYVDAQAVGIKQTAGLTTFANVVLVGDKGLKAKQAELLLSTDGGEILAVTGRGVQLKTDGDRKAALIPLDKSRRAAVVIELKLARGGQIVDGRGKSLLKVALKSPAKDGALSAFSEFAWPVDDCAGDFHAALGSILANKGDLVGKLMEIAKTEDKSLPGAWLFSPRISSKSGNSKNARVCLEQTRKWNATKKRAQKVCTKWQDEAPDPALASVPKPPESMKVAEIFELASGFVSARGAAAVLRRGGKFERLVYQINRDIKGYMSQKSHPALCTGTDYMMQYYQDNSKSFRSIVTRLKLAKTAGREHIWYRIDRLRDGLQSVAGATLSRNSGGGSSLSIVTPAQAAGAQQQSILLLIDEVAGLVLTANDADAVRRETAPIAALSMFRDLAKTGGLDHLSEDNRQLASQVLSMLEATQYVDLANVRMASVHDALFANIGTIKDEHKRTCVCGT